MCSIRAVIVTMVSATIRILGRIAVIAIGVALLYRLCGTLNKRPSLEVDWINIQGGEFSMGWPIEGGNIDSLPEESRRVHIFQEMPRHGVHVGDFSVMRNEVSVRQYRNCVEADACPVPRQNPSSNYYATERSNFPMNCVDFFEAQNFCRWVGGRLPSEAEWEFAARGRGREVMYPWGNDAPTCDRIVRSDRQMTCNNDSYTEPICSRWNSITPQGLCDMAGNVWEWTEDLWHQNYQGAPQDGSPWRLSPAFNANTLRGGGPFSTMDFRTTHRVGHAPQFAYPGLGFRCAKSTS